MGNATSSALRADDPVTSAPATGADGPAFGSLSTLGGPRKFKKKPVLVLDPEELEKAHMLFQDASAELLGEDVERPERPAPLLGLAPMALDDSEADDVDPSDDADDIEEDDLPSAEDVLRMTASRPAAEEADEAAIAEHLERLDFDRRIFPSLPLKSEDQIAAEEEAERLAAGKLPALDDEALDDVTLDDPTLGDEGDEDTPADAPLDDVWETDPVAESEDEDPAPRIDVTQEPAADSQYIYIPPFDEIRARPLFEDDVPERPAANIATGFPVNPLPEPEAEVESPLPVADDAEADWAEADWAEDDLPPEPEEAPEPLASAKAIFGDAPFLDFPSQPIVWVPASEGAQEAEPIADEPEAELPPATLDADTPDAFEEPSNRFEWAYEDDEEEPDNFQQREPDEAYEDQSEPEPELEQEGESNFTEVDDDQVDGYAFMYAHNPRGRTIHALADGESNSLRAKLIKEREDALADQDADAGNPSVWDRFTGWLRGLLG